MDMLEKEQWSDLHWASDVISGRGDKSDTELSASNMLESLSLHGVTPQIRQAASVTRLQGVAEAA